MARSLHSIEMDFSKAKRQAKDLDELATNLERLSGSQLEGMHWTGDNSLKYIGKGKTLQGNINKTAQAIHDVAQAIRDIASTIYEAEMEAWERAHNRD